MPVHAASTALIRDPSSVPKARRWVRSQVTGWGVRLDDTARDAIDLVTSELATNAVRHTVGAMITLGVYVHPHLRRLVVEVYDGSAALPRPRSVGPDDASGRGMFLVEHLAAAHGTELTERGKKVWAELELPEQPLTRRQLLAHPRRAARAVARSLGGRRRPPIHPAALAPAS
ncbi:ATP-binding protein [Kitasatospora sp. NPDC059795]|uniref:ATP-binding protein n=1 Tax=Kitasatospora sp. NPDC059795 TaxID=3346949 RepID=UPI003652D954